MPCYIKQSIFCGCPCKNNRNKPVTKVVGESLFTGTIQGFPGGSVAKNLPVNAGDLGLMPGSGRSSGEGNGNPLRYSCLGNPMDRGAWRAPVHGVT